MAKTSLPCYTCVMTDHTATRLSAADARAQRKLERLYASAGIRRDARLEETYGIYDDDYNLLAAGSLSGATLRCIAVDPSKQGEGLLGTLLTRLIERQAERGHLHVFLYTKPASAPVFKDLGFHEIARAGDVVVFMENRPRAFAEYLRALSAAAPQDGRTAAVVMNANPFTLGHQYLVQRAAAENDAVRCFVVSEDISLVPYEARIALVRAGTKGIANVTVHPSGPYIVSSATFPSYFLKDSDQVTRAQAQLDIEVFARIAKAMNITRRYIGEEPFSAITRAYNAVMQQALPAHGIECVLIPRREMDGAAISASGVRQLLHDGPAEAIRPYVPESTYAYFSTEDGRRTLRRIRETERVQHD